MHPLFKRIDWFLAGILIAVGLAWEFPDPGAQGGWMHPEILTNLGIALIFFLHGLLLPLAALKDGASRWKLHLVVQLSTFLAMPLIGIGLLRLFGHAIPADLHLGFLFLSALPSTVSSSVAMTAAARGNVPAAVFNATLSSLLGIALTPLWINLFAHANGSLPLGHVIRGLLCWLMLPLVMGQAMRPWFGAWAMRHKPFVSKVDRGTILLLVYTSFCDSVKWGVWTTHGLRILWIAALGVLVLFVIILSGTLLACRAWRMNRPDTIAAVFCGSKKSLAQGVPMARLMFAGNPAAGLILMPSMLYHPLQLFLCGILASRWAKRTGD